MPKMPKWTRSELAAAERTAEMMGLTTRTVLQRYTAESRRRQAAEHGLPVEEYIQANLAADWFLTQVEDGHERGDSPETIAAAVGKPVEDIRKILAGLYPEGGRPSPTLSDDDVAAAVAEVAAAFTSPSPARWNAEAPGPVEWTRGERASAALGAAGARMTPEAFLDKEVRENRRLVPAARGLSAAAWAEELSTTDHLLARIEEAHVRGDSPADIAASLGKPVEDIQPVIHVISQETEEAPRKPRKERDPEAQRRAQAVSIQLKVSMQTAWKGYDQDNADRIAAEDEMIRVMKRLRALGLSYSRIADEIGGTAESLEGMLGKYGSLV
jgi:hypothetical protein